jgi:protein-export membrane protein SecD
VVLVLLAALALGFQSITLGNFERGGDDTPLGLTLGLDLQGGSHLIYRAVLDDGFGERVAPSADQMQGLLKTIERRVNSAGLGEPILQLMGEDRLLIQLPGVRDPGRAKRLIGETAQLEFKHRTLGVLRDIEGVTADSLISVQLGTTIDPEEGETGPIFRPGTSTTPILLGAPSTSTTTAAAVVPAPTATSTPGSEGALTGATSRATTTSGLFSDIVTPSPSLLVEFQPAAAEAFATLLLRMESTMALRPGARRAYPDLLTIGAQGESGQPLRVALFPLLRLEDGTVFTSPIGVPKIQRVEDTDLFIIDVSDQFTTVGDIRARFGNPPRLVFGEEIGALDSDIGLTGDDLARAYPGQHQSTGLPIVNIEFNTEGTRTFGEITSRIAGTPDQLAIVLDDEELVAPVVTQPITGGTAYIQGIDFTLDRVRDIALLLEGGRLPVPIELIQERDIDAILGEDSLAKSVVAGLVGLALVLLFMVVYYRAPGVIAALALLIYATIVLAVFKILPVTLTLSGVAASILSIGMAVDANILIFERMKEELRAGRTLLSSINIGFNRAWPAIRDSNVSTLITCGILFWFADTLGITIVQGFAITLAIGVGISMFSAIVVSRTLLRILALSPVGRSLGLFVPSGGQDLPQQQPVAPRG